jgi:hypothetical protein
LIVQFDMPDDERTMREWNTLIRECIDPLRRENVTLYAWKVATGEVEGV